MVRQSVAWFGYCGSDKKTGDRTGSGRIRLGLRSSDVQHRLKDRDQADISRGGTVDMFVEECQRYSCQEKDKEDVQSMETVREQIKVVGVRTVCPVIGRRRIMEAGCGRGLAKL